MTPLTQTKLHIDSRNGNCLATALASILEISVSRVPEFENMGDDWFVEMLKWLESIGLDLVQWQHEVVLPGYYLVMGTSPRDEKINHQVIYKNGELVHDPHPSRDGLVNIKEVMAILPLDPAMIVLCL